MTTEIYYATGNNGKFAEVKYFFQHNAPEMSVQQFAADIEEIQSLDQEKIAIDKAQKAWDILKKPLLVDDSGIFFDAYPLFPGTMSKFIYQSLGFEGVLKLVDANNKAAFILKLVYTDGKQMQVFEGRCDGIIVRPTDFSAPKQLPFKAIFKPDGSNKTYAELFNTPEFSKFAFRERALKKFLMWHKTVA